MTLYMPPHFRVDDPDRLYGLVEAHPFGALISTGSAGLHVSHIPFLPERTPEGGLRLLGHLARANPQCQALESAQQLMAVFQGPHAYVSPGWYAQHPSVPTWNYAVVHAHGRARMMEEAELHELLMRLSAEYESSRPAPWKMSDLPPDYVNSMLQHIRGFELVVERLEGKFKLSQNRSAEITRVIAGLRRDGEDALADLMEPQPAESKG